MVGMGSRALPGEISSVKVGEKSAARVNWGECNEPQQFTVVAVTLGLHPQRVKQGQSLVLAFARSPQPMITKKYH
jgi:hypothetical protein